AQRNHVICRQLLRLAATDASIIELGKQGDPLREGKGLAASLSPRVPPFALNSPPINIPFTPFRHAPEVISVGLSGPPLADHALSPLGIRFTVCRRKAFIHARMVLSPLCG